MRGERGVVAYYLGEFAINKSLLSRWPLLPPSAATVQMHCATEFGCTTAQPEQSKAKPERCCSKRELLHLKTVTVAFDADPTDDGHSGQKVHFCLPEIAVLCTVRAGARTVHKVDFL